MKNILYIINVYNNDEYIGCVSRKSEKAVSNYANRMWRKYGDSVTVKVGYFDDNCNWIDFCTYHA